MGEIDRFLFCQKLFSMPKAWARRHITANVRLTRYWKKEAEPSRLKGDKMQNFHVSSSIHAAVSRWIHFFFLYIVVQFLLDAIFPHDTWGEGQPYCHQHDRCILLSIAVGESVSVGRQTGNGFQGVEGVDSIVVGSCCSAAASGTRISCVSQIYDCSWIHTFRAIVNESHKIIAGNAVFLIHSILSCGCAFRVECNNIEESARRTRGCARICAITPK